MLKAARLGDQITHSQQRSGLIGGMIVGALVGAALVAGTIATVLTGGLALAPILLIVGAVGTGAAVGGGLGRLAGSMDFAAVPKGAINKAAATVFINGIAAARACVDTALCQDHTLQLIATGSTTVAIEGFPAARVSDTGACSFQISKGSSNVFIGGETGACAGVSITPEVEPWLEYLHMATGLIGGFALAAPALGFAGAGLVTAMGFGGSMLGAEIGGRYGKGWAIAGGILGGILAGGFGTGIARGLGRAGYRGFQPLRTPAIQSPEIAFKSGWNSERVLASPKGSRPNPSEYLDDAYINNHLSKFDEGGGYLTPKDALDRFGRERLGRPDGQFLMPKSELDDLLQRANGDVSVIETELGIPSGTWQGRELSRIDVPNPRSLEMRMPSGNEAGANELWLPGGKLPTGQSEAVVNQIIKGSYTETPIGIRP